MPNVAVVAMMVVGAIIGMVIVVMPVGAVVPIGRPVIAITIVGLSVVVMMMVAVMIDTAQNHCRSNACTDAPSPSTMSFRSIG